MKPREEWEELKSLFADKTFATWKHQRLVDIKRNWCKVIRRNICWDGGDGRVFVFTAAVVAAASAAAVEVSGHVGAKVSIRCSGNWTTPGNSSEHHQLYFCRDACTGQSVIIQSTGGEAGVTRRGRYSVEADGGDGAFKVTIAELRKTDAGTYQCGVRKSMVALYQEVSLIILDGTWRFLLHEMR